MFDRLFRKDPMKAPARQVYLALLEASRRPFLFGERGAPDTVDGRFDMIVLHAVLVFRRLRPLGDAGKHFNQLVFDILFDDMDAGLREMGTGDLSVGKRIREMGEAFYGRASAYEPTLEAGDADALALIVERNLFASESEAESVTEAGEAARRIASYALAAERYLADQEAEAILAGAAPRFPSAA
jgi:cytochrome b pre-mRNA-processing protein 3